MALPNTADVGVRLLDLGVKGDFLKLPGHPQACRRLRLPSIRRSRAVPAAGQRRAVAFALPEQTSGGYEGHLRFPLTSSATRPPIFFMAEADRELGRGVLPVPPLLSQRARPGSDTRNPRHEVRQVLPVPGLLELALHGSGCPKQLPALLPVPVPPRSQIWGLRGHRARCRFATPGGGTVAAGTSHALSPVSQNKYGRTFLMGEGAPWR